VGCGIVLAKVGLDFHDAGRQAQLSEVADEHLAEEFASYTARAAGEEGATEGPERRKTGRREHKSECRRQRAKVKTDRS